jgi:threonine synthase
MDFTNYMNSLKFYSTNLKADAVTFSEALLKGLAPDKGLYMPEEIPSFTKDEILAFSKMEYYEIAFEVIRKFLKGEIPENDLLELVKDAYNYEVPLEKVVDNKFVMRLDQGPTASFKDFAARMMGRLINYYLKLQGREITILTATSGDTGSAVASAFYGLDSVKVLILFPETEVTNRQRKQMTTLGKNVKTIALNGKFDDCQALVKEAFSDADLNYLNLSSANSINIGRLIPQIVYYFYSFAKLRSGNVDDNIIFSIPSGNFGDMMGSVFGMKMGLPVKKFVIATNANDEFTTFLQTGKYEKIEPSKNCISSAMNVGHPSNLARLIAVYGGIMDEKGNISKAPNMEKMRNDIFAISVSDADTKTNIKETYDKHKVILEPHGSVAWRGLMEYLKTNTEDKNQLCVSLETAHPAKFPEHIIDIIGIDPELPKSLEGLENKAEFVSNLNANYVDFKAYLKKNY